ncbi:VENN motif pre-toxin domain-containing protein [Stenotrophomonas indicatrix]|uniref:VENN motif pre-toxin domain-containing protein n=1 Tax=Stenotrophomonas indicatrix TaxID=2045451 RepID=UPI0039C9411F
MTGQNISLKAEGDTTLRGATATADRIDVKTGGTLTIESLQDMAESMSKNSQVGGRVQVAFGNAWNADGYASAGKAEGSYQGVGQQSGLFAGNGGYHVDAGHVNLIGGAISSTNAANSEMTAQTLTFSDLQNQMDYSASSGSISGGAGGKMNGWDAKEGTTAPRGGPGMPMSESGSDSSSTLATLTEGNITIGGKQTTAAELGINTDASAAHRALEALPDAAKLLADQQAMAGAIGTVVSTSQQIANDIGSAGANKITDKYREGLSVEERRVFDDLTSDEQFNRLVAFDPTYPEALVTQQKWAPDGVYGRALGAVTTALVGGVAGQGLGQLGSNALAPYAAELIGKTFDPNKQSAVPSEAMQMLSHALLGALLAEANGGSAGSGALAAGGGELAAKVLTDTLFGGNPANLSPQQREAVLALSQAVGALAGGLSGQDLAGIALNAGIARNSVENNFLGKDDQQRLADLREKSKKGKLTPQESAELIYLDGGDHMSDGLLNMLASGQPLSVVQQHNLELYLGAYAQQNGTDAAIALVSGGIREASEFPYSGLSRDKQKYTDENFSFFEKNIWRADSENEAIFNKAVIRSGLEVWRSEDLLPTVMRQRRDFALMDALVGSPLASGSYLFGSLVGLSDDDRYALTMTAGNIALIAGATAAGKTGLLPVTGRLGINPVGEGGQKSSASSRRRVGESPRSDSVSVSTNSGTIKASETIGQPVEAVINGRKRMLRVDIEPNGKLQIQSGGGKDSFVDFRPDLSLPLAPQIDKAFRRLPKSARDQLVRNAEKGLRRLQETGNM